MPAWSNNDSITSKPKFANLRTTREVVQLTVANTAFSGGSNSTITFTYYDGTASSNLSNVISIGNYVIAANVGANGVSGFFKSNNNVVSISANSVTFTTPLWGNVVTGSTVEFDKAITYSSSHANNSFMFADTILITDTRLANTANNGYPNTAYMFGNQNSGWVKIRQKTNADGTVRYLKETMVCLASPVASNVNSGNTSQIQAFTGL